ncbi:MAG: ATP-binding protein [Oscillospiraceae bacterium]|nr:ATP-binding protein [Oscillospiraceae bacterium]
MAFDRLTYEKAEHAIKQRRFSADNRLAERMNEIGTKIPEINQIINTLSQTSIELSKLIIRKETDFSKNFNKIKEQNLHGQAMIKQLLVQNNYPENYLEPIYTCPDCRDKGYINGERCSCFNKLLTRFAVEKLNSEANMPECDFEHFSLDYYKGTSNPNCPDCHRKMTENLAFCKHYAQNFSLKSDSLFILGQTGIGKTHISLSIAKEVSEKGYTVAYGSLLNYLRIIEKEHFGRTTNSENDTLQILIDADLLILDDLGSEFQTNFYESTLYNIINTRINLGLPTIISSNLSAEELQRHYNERIISRLFSVFTTLMFFGDDIRQLKRLRNEF